jgi:hypothetical protein
LSILEKLLDRRWPVVMVTRTRRRRRRRGGEGVSIIMMMMMMMMMMRRRRRETLFLFIILLLTINQRWMNTSWQRRTNTAHHRGMKTTTLSFIKWMRMGKDITHLSTTSLMEMRIFPWIWQKRRGRGQYNFIAGSLLFDF